MSIGSHSWNRQDAARSAEPPSGVAGDTRSKSVCADCGKTFEMPLQWRPIPAFVVRNDPEVLRCRACDGEDTPEFRAGCCRNRVQGLWSRRHCWEVDRKRITVDDELA